MVIILLYRPDKIAQCRINGAFDLKFTSGNYDWDASNYEIGPFGHSLPLTTGNNRTMNLGEMIRLFFLMLLYVGTLKVKYGCIKSFLI